MGMGSENIWSFVVGVKMSGRGLGLVDVQAFVELVWKTGIPSFLFPFVSFFCKNSVSFGLFLKPGNICLLSKKITSALAFSSSPPHLPSRISHPPFARLGEDSGLYFLLIPSPSVLLPSGVDLVYWFFFFTLLNSRFFF
jgi:hypothetical protein